jgi:hypothetical protein
MEVSSGSASNVANTGSKHCDCVVGVGAVSGRSNRRIWDRGEPVGVVERDDVRGERWAG